jgi:hypothetical protein
MVPRIKRLTFKPVLPKYVYSIVWPPYHVIEILVFVFRHDPRLIAPPPLAIIRPGWGNGHIKVAYIYYNISMTFNKGEKRKPKETRI